MDDDEAEDPGPDYVARLILARCPELSEADLTNLNGPLANLMVEAIDALAGKIDQLALRVEAKEEVLARMAGFSEAVDAVRSCLTVAQEVGAGGQLKTSWPLAESMVNLPIRERTFIPSSECGPTPISTLRTVCVPTVTASIITEREFTVDPSAMLTGKPPPSVACPVAIKRSASFAGI
jgi:hypothetical protein